MRRAFLIAAACWSVALMLWGTVATAEIQRTIDAEEASMAKDGALVDDGFEYNVSLKGPRNSRRSWISPSMAFGGAGHAVGYEAKPLPPGRTLPDGGMQKVMHELFAYGPRSDFIQFGKKRYTGFAFYIAPDSAAPSKLTLLYQVWQGSPFGPPFAVALGMGEEYQLELRFRVLNDETGSNPSARPRIIGTAPVEAGRWYKLVVMTIARHQNMADDGEIKVWLADCRHDNWDAGYTRVLRHFGSIGYDPAGFGNYPRNRDTHPNSELEAAFGIYREAQRGTLRVYFDEVVHGHGFKDVAIGGMPRGD